MLRFLKNQAVIKQQLDSKNAKQVSQIVLKIIQRPTNTTSVIIHKHAKIQSNSVNNRSSENKKELPILLSLMKDIEFSFKRDCID